jgi:hypothetical protein
MTKQTYKTAQGRPIDMGALKLRNENERAVGNLKVNARGDIIDESNNVISNRSDQIMRQYEKQTTLSDAPVTASKPRSNK